MMMIVLVIIVKGIAVNKPQQQTADTLNTCVFAVCLGDQHKHSLSDGSRASSHAQSNCEHGADPAGQTCLAEAGGLAPRPGHHITTTVAAVGQLLLLSDDRHTLRPVVSRTSHRPGVLRPILLSEPTRILSTAILKPFLHRFAVSPFRHRPSPVLRHLHVRVPRWLRPLAAML